MQARPVLLLMAVICSAACQQPASEPAPGPAASSPPSESSPATPAAVSVGTLSGAWRVAGIDGKPFDESYGLALTGDQNMLWWEPRCAGMARKYRIDGNSVAFTSAHPPAKAGSPTPPVCTIGLPPRLDEVFRALDRATSIARTPENGIRIAGGGHELLLFSQ